MAFCMAIDPRGLMGWQSWIAFYHLDLEVYRGGGAALLRGEDLYDLAVQTWVGPLPFTYPPFAAALFAPLSLVSSPVAGALWSWATIAAFYGCALALARAAGSTHARQVALWATGAAVVADPLWETLTYGQINVFLVALVVVDFVVLPRGHKARGVLTGIAIAIKLTPAVFLAAFLALRDWRGAAQAVGGFLVAGGIGWAVSPGSSRRYWTEVLWESDRIGTPYFVSNQSWRGAVERLTHGGNADVADTLWLAGVGLMAAVLAYGLWCVLRTSGSRSAMNAAVTADADAKDLAVTAMFLASLAALFGSPVSWAHHFIWFLLAAVWFGVRGRAWWEASTATALWALMLLRPHWQMPNSAHGGDAELHWSWWHHVLGNDYAWAALGLAVILAICGRRLAQRPPGNPCPQPANA